MIIASRALFVTGEGGHLPVPVEIHQPVQRDDGSWECEITIAWPEGLASYRTGGYDGAQAIINALQMAAVQLYSSTYHEAGTLFWTKPGQGYGFPISSNGRNMLEGYDKEFFG